MTTLWKELEGRRIYVILKNGKNYSGKVLTVDFRDDKFFFSVRDKFDKIIIFPDNEISVIQEERDLD